MTTEKKTSPGEFSTPSDAMTQNMARVEALVQRVLTVMGQNTPTRPALQGPGAELFTKAAAAYMNTAVTNPSQMFEQQLSFWGASVQNFIELQTNLCGNAANSKELPKDPRFANPLWESHPYFKAVRQQYLVNAEAMRDAVTSSELDAKDHSRLEYFTQQIIDMASPTNFLGTNPDALSRAVETEGESLVKGLENLVRDLEANGGEMLVTLADQDAFTVGEDLATTPGKVVFRNRMFELIQYTPTTEKVAKTPLIIFPPWINKFYILDLKPKNSFVKWAVDQGQTVFVVSWVNPDETYADVTLDDYIEEGFLTAIEQVKTICDVPQVNAIGYCIAGTTLSITLGLMAQRGDTSVASATFFTTMTDFSDPGEVGVYLDNDFLGGIEAEVSDNGIMSKMFMSRTFSYLRAND
ncbi:MAG: PHA/PHB synthase family protein, partial [Planktomarina sp.]